MNTHDNSVVSIPLNKLVEDKDNVRKTGRKDGIAELAASIQAQGLLQGLVVKDVGGGKYAVSAGGRRLRALRQLAKSGDLEKNAPIPCKIIDADKAVEASLAENVVRSNMHAADEIDAFARLVDAGEGPEAIAGRFGVSGQHVARRLKLARVSPRLIEAFRKDDLDLDQLSALAFSDDHAAQDAAYFDAPEWARTPERLRAQLAQAHIPSTDKLVRFVGVEPYKEAGGVCVSDLFAEEGDDETVIWLTDRDLLVRLAETKLSAFADEARSEGWAWVEIAIDGVAWTQFPERVRERHRPVTDEQAAEQDRLLAMLDETQDEAEIEALEEKIDALTVTEWNVSEVALAGAIVTLAHDGAVRIERGLVRTDDAKRLRALRKRAQDVSAVSSHEESGESESDHEVVDGATPCNLPRKLVDELMAHKTLALRTDVAGKPDLALRLTVLALASNAFSNDCASFSLVRLKVDEIDVTRQISRCDSKAPEAYASLLDAWKERLPSDVDGLWAFVSAADVGTLLDLLAIFVAPAIELQSGRASDVTDAICDAAGLDMSQHWQATPASFFDHVRRDVVLDAVRQFKPTAVNAKLEKASKKEVVARAKRIFKGSAWLPEILRTAATENEPLAIAAE